LQKSLRHKQKSRFMPDSPAASLDAAGIIATVLTVMSTLRRQLLQAEGPRRVLAAGGIALVLLLSVLMVNPELHELFHHHDRTSHEEDGCAVVLFAHGVSAPFDTAMVAATPAEWLVLSRPEAVEIFLTSSRYLHQPERGPPVS
jgi:hypothetical protein